jgi:RecA-family ATPase
MNLDLRRIAAALGGEVSKDQVLAPGPGHSAADRSLSVRLNAKAPDGFLVHSFASDDPIACKAYVREKCGLPAFKANGARQHRSSSDVAKLMREAVLSQQQEAPKGRLIATHDYTDANGVLLYQVLKYEPKDYLQRRPDGNGGWIWDRQGRRVLFRLPELLKYPDATVFFTEGEKDAERVATLGHCATTLASGTWTSECAQALAGRDVWILEDNDDKGRKRAQEAVEALNGTAKSIRVVRLPGLPERGDVSDWLDAGHSSDELIEACTAAAPWKAGASVEKSNGAQPQQEPEKPPPLQWANTSGWDHEPCPDRDWAVLERIPLRQVTLFSGEGAIGKSITELMLSVAHVTTKDWLGSLPEPGGAFYLGGEDDEKEIRIRLTAIAAHYGTTFDELKASGFRFKSLSGEDAILGAPDRNGIIKPTALYDQLYEEAGDLKPKHIGIDTSADVFAGSEIDRSQVRQFINLLKRLAIVSNGSVVLLSHPSLTGINTGSGISGSTAWHNSVRSRFYMTAPKIEPGEQPDTDLREILFKKANYGRKGDSLVLRYQRGLFLPVAGMGTLDKLAAEQAADQLFLELLDKFSSQGRNVSHLKTSNSYAPTMFASDPKAKAPGIKKTLGEAMERLFEAKKIKAEPYGAPSKHHQRIVRC